MRGKAMLDEAWSRRAIAAAVALAASVAWVGSAGALVSSAASEGSPRRAAITITASSAVSSKSGKTTNLVLSGVGAEAQVQRKGESPSSIATFGAIRLLDDTKSVAAEIESTAGGAKPDAVKLSHIQFDEESVKVRFQGPVPEIRRLREKVRDPDFALGVRIPAPLVDGERTITFTEDSLLLYGFSDRIEILQHPERQAQGKGAWTYNLIPMAAASARPGGE